MTIHLGDEVTDFYWANEFLASVFPTVLKVCGEDTPHLELFKESSRVANEIVPIIKKEYGEDVLTKNSKDLVKLLQVYKRAEDLDRQLYSNKEKK